MPSFKTRARTVLRFLGALATGRADDAPAIDAGNWQRFGILAPGIAAGLIVVLLLAVFLLNPFGNFPQTPFSQTFAHHNQRYAYPSIARSGDYDSAVFGTSTSRLLPPEDLDRAFGGRFAALSMDASSAWEQTQLTRLFLRAVPHPRTLLLSLDPEVWCAPDADTRRVTFRLFPQSFYDDDRLNDVSDLLNLELPEVLRRSLRMASGGQEPYFRPDGFGDFTQGEGAYDAERARRALHGGAPPQTTPAALPRADDASIAPRPQDRFPALVWLEETLALVPRETRTILVSMPVHVVAQARVGTELAAQRTECARRILALGRAAEAFVLDMGFASPLTVEDTNYWDRVHFRLPIGRQVIGEIAAAVDTGAETPNLRVLAMPTRAGQG
ncbi:hypothetical protein [Aureimonas mangrovi]|uniref:hypothetical protein n=1 Tax=Aureimonas mangrovi TaxID=2758041 RepID=UPI00163DD5FA|nr:hypothetical protein [Aureimonas mangrovi]